MGVAARSTWSGSLSFGLVTVPVKLYTAQDEGGDLAFKQVCREHGTLVKQPKKCEFNGHDVMQAEIVKGFPNGDGFVIVEKDELEALPLASNKELAISEFVPAAQVLDPVMVKTVYYVKADKVGQRAYALLTTALHKSGRAGLGKIAMRMGREQLGAVISDGVQLRLVLLLWPDEIRSGEQFVDTTAVADAEVEMATKLIKSMAGNYDPANYQDDYRKAAMALIESKIAGTAAPAASTEGPHKAAMDLMEALKASVDAAA